MILYEGTSPPDYPIIVRESLWGYILYILAQGPAIVISGSVLNFNIRLFKLSLCYIVLWL